MAFLRKAGLIPAQFIVTERLVLASERGESRRNYEPGKRCQKLRVSGLGLSGPRPGAESRPAPKTIPIAEDAGAATGCSTVQRDRRGSIPRWAACVRGIPSDDAD